MTPLVTRRPTFDRWWTVEGSGFATAVTLHAVALAVSAILPNSILPSVGTVLAMPLYLVGGLALGWTLPSDGFSHFADDAPFVVPRLGLGAALFAVPVGLLVFGPVVGVGYSVTAWFLVFAGGFAGTLHTD